MVNAKDYGFVNKKVKKDVSEILDRWCDQYHLKLSDLLTLMIVIIEDKKLLDEKFKKKKYSF